MRGERLGPFLSALPLMHTPRGKHQGLRDARREIGSNDFFYRCYFASRSSSRPYGSATVRGVSRSATGRAFRVLHLVSPASAWLGAKRALPTPRRRQGGFCPSPRRGVTFAIPPAGTAVRRTKVRARCPERPPSR